MLFTGWVEWKLGCLMDRTDLVAYKSAPWSPFARCTYSVCPEEEDDSDSDWFATLAFTFFSKRDG